MNKTGVWALWAGRKVLLKTSGPVRKIGNDGCFLQGQTIRVVSRCREYRMKGAIRGGRGKWGKWE